jgi:hypothetical protein
MIGKLKQHCEVCGHSFDRHKRIKGHYICQFYKCTCDVTKLNSRNWDGTASHARVLNAANAEPSSAKPKIER